MARVFASYAEDDRNSVLPIIAALRRRGDLDVFDPHELLAGEPIAERLQRELDTANCILVFWSNGAARSPWVQKEVYRAIQGWSSDRLVLATLDDAPLPVGLRDLQTTPLQSVTNRVIHQLTAGSAVEKESTVNFIKLNQLTAVSAVEKESTVNFIKRRLKDFAHSPKGWLVTLAGLGLLAISLLVGSFYRLNSSLLFIDGIEVKKLIDVSRGFEELILLISTIFGLGAVTGGVALWAWTGWSRKRSNSAPPANPPCICKPRR